MAFCFEEEEAHFEFIQWAMSHIWVSVVTETEIQAISPLPWIWIEVGIWVLLISRSVQLFHYSAAFNASSTIKRWWLNVITYVNCWAWSLGFFLTRYRWTFLLLLSLIAFLPIFKLCHSVPFLILISIKL